MHSIDQGSNGRRLQTRLSLHWTRHRLNYQVTYERSSSDEPMNLKVNNIYNDTYIYSRYEIVYTE